MTLPPPASTTDVYLAAVVDRLDAVVDRLDALLAALTPEPPSATEPVPTRKRAPKQPPKP